MNRASLLVCAAFQALIAACAVLAQPADDFLLKGFQDPPDSARPRVWWHWMNGNITWEGARADMDWMKRVGIRGCGYRRNRKTRANTYGLTWARCTIWRRYGSTAN